MSALDLSPAARTFKALAWRMRERLRPRPRESLLHHAVRRYSQNGEDGMLAELFRRVGPGTRTFVEFGVGDGAQCCTRALAEAGWTGLWIDPGAIASAPAGVRTRQAFLTRENVAEVLLENGVSRNVDLLVVDVDGNDYHLLAALLAEGFAPRALVVEYNASVEPGVSWVMPYDPAHRWDLSNRFGASLTALAALARDHRLVACDAEGVNAFFVAEALAHAFPCPGDVDAHYMSPKYCGLAFGHPSR